MFEHKKNRSKNNRRKIAACLLSLALHVVLLGTFAAVKFAGLTEESFASAKSQAKVVLPAESPFLPPPKIKPVQTKKTQSLQPIEIEAVDKTKAVETEECKASASETVNETQTSFQSTNFFGSQTRCRRICFVVDSSGSMQGVFSRVQDELIRCVRSLYPDQYFEILFFGNGRVRAFADNMLVRANSQTKDNAETFIRQIKPTGPTNAIQALMQAFRSRDTLEQYPQAVFFLSDGFELNTSKESFFRKVQMHRKLYAADATIHTIGFWCRDEDRDLMKTISENSNGTFMDVASDIENKKLLDLLENSENNVQENL